MMKKYRVTVNGTAYEIELEELSASAAAQTTPTAQTTPAGPAAQTAAAPVPAGGERIIAPMPGTILSVSVTAGGAVKKGQVLMILEAMKMENEILCPRDGTVASVSVAAGAAVESGTLLCALQ